jgi:beclin
VYEQNSKQDFPPLIKRVVPVRGSPPTTESFVVLTQSQIPRGTSSPSSSTTKSSESSDVVSQRYRVSAKLFDAISAHSDIDYPMCADCADILLEIMSAKQVQVKKERDGYLEFIKQFQSEGTLSQEDKLALEKELVVLRAEEETALRELQSAEEELAALKTEMSRLEEESTLLNAEENAFWKTRNAFSLAIQEFQTERAETAMKHEHDMVLLERLQRTNVYNDAFCITHDGFFGVINGLRLGRLPNKQVHSRRDKLT